MNHSSYAFAQNFRLCRMNLRQIVSQDLKIYFQICDCDFGSVMIACTSMGVCHLQFFDQQKIAFERLKDYFPGASLIEARHKMHTAALSVLRDPVNRHDIIDLHLRGTDFQISVWNALLSLSIGESITYGNLAKKIGHPKAGRAVGSAVAKNPVGYIIPCHRVIPARGGVGKYLWGATRKAALLAWEAEQVQQF